MIEGEQPDEIVTGGLRYSRIDDPDTGLTLDAYGFVGE